MGWDSAQNKSILTFYVKSNIPTKKPLFNTSLNLTDYPIYNSNNKIFEPKLIQLEKGAIFQIQTKASSSEIIMAYIEKPDALLTFPLIKIEADIFASDLINPILFKNAESCGFLFYSDSVQKYKFGFNPTIVFHNSNDIVFSISK